MAAKIICDVYPRQLPANPHKEGMVQAEYRVIYNNDNSNFGYQHERDYCADCFRILLDNWKTGGFPKEQQASITRLVS